MNVFYQFENHTGYKPNIIFLGQKEMLMFVSDTKSLCLKEMEKKASGEIFLNDVEVIQVSKTNYMRCVL